MEHDKQHTDAEERQDGESAEGEQAEQVSEKVPDEASGGVPRMINILCDTALVYGFANGIQTISSDIVAQVIADKQQYSILPLHKPSKIAKYL